MPSPQLVGTPERKTLDLNTLTASGVRLVGRVGAIVGGKAILSDALANLCKPAEYQSDYSWLHIPVLDRKGEVQHDGGIVTDAPGLYRIGLSFLRRRKSSFIHGAEDDARDLTDHLASYLKHGEPGPPNRTSSVTGTASVAGWT